MSKAAVGNVEMMIRETNGPLSRNPWAWSHPLQVALQQLFRQVREELLECGTVPTSWVYIIVKLGHHTSSLECGEGISADVVLGDRIK